MNNPIIKITMDDDSTILLELYPDIAPITVKNFLNLVNQNYFDNLCFHRVIKNFMIQGGGYYIDGNTIKEAKKLEPIKGEFKSNGVNNTLKHEPGVISMARTSDPNSATSQFFICSATTPHLDGDYAAFGKTIDQESLDNVMRISKVSTVNVGGGMTDFPYPIVYIKSIEQVK